MNLFWRFGSGGPRCSALSFFWNPDKPQSLALLSTRHRLLPNRREVRITDRVSFPITSSGGRRDRALWLSLGPGKRACAETNFPARPSDKLNYCIGSGPGAMKTSVWLIIGGAKHRSIRRRQSQRAPELENSRDPKRIRTVQDFWSGRRSAPARVNSVFLQCEVVAYRLAACAEVALDYWRFVVSRLAPEESQVSPCQHQRHSPFW